MRRSLILTLGFLWISGTVSADVSLVERVQNGKEKRAGRVGTHFTGEESLTNPSGLEYFINSDITFSTTSSASGAVSDASYSGPVLATTSEGGTTSSTLNDAFDGYNSLCVSLVGATGPCSTESDSYTIYNNNGAGSLDESCENRQLVLNSQAIGGLSVQRKVFVAANDEFIRWLNIVTNTSKSSVSVSLITANNLGSDSATVLVSSSDGDASAELTDTWISTFQNYSGVTSPDVRLGHVLQGTGAASPLVNLTVVNGDDSPYWAYTFALAPGETKIIMNFATGQPSKAEANAKAAELALLPPSALQCISPTEQQQIVNFRATLPAAQIFSTSNNEFASGVSVAQEGVYGTDLEGSEIELIAAFLPPAVGLDAVELLDDGRIAFSTASNSTVDGEFLRHERAYIYDPSEDSILPAFSWGRHRIASLDALAVLPDGSWAFSTSSNQLAGNLYLRHQNAYRYDPKMGISLLFNGQAIGLTSLDAFDWLPGDVPVFSTGSAQFLKRPAGLQLKPQNAYQRDPATGHVSLIFDGQALGLRTLDAVSLASQIKH